MAEEIVWFSSGLSWVGCCGVSLVLLLTVLGGTAAVRGHGFSTSFRQTNGSLGDGEE